MNTPTIEQRPAGAKQAAKVPVTAAPKRMKPFLGHMGSLAQYKRNTWMVFAPEEVPVADFESPAMWTIVGRDYMMWDRVEIVQRKRWTEAVVCDVGIGFTNVKVLQSIEVPERSAGAERKVPEGYEIRAGQPGGSPFEVWRLKDNFMMSANHFFGSHEQALRWLVDHAIFRT